MAVKKSRASSARVGNRALKHEQIKRIIREAIVSGELRPGDCIPSQNVMKARYGVSHNTVREAIGSLEHEGLLYRIQGKGTYVADRKPPLRTLALVFPHLFLQSARESIVGYEVIGPLVAAIEDEARKNNATIVLRLDQDRPEIERENLLGLLDQQVDGAIVFHLREDANVDCLRKIQESGLPLVLIDRYHEQVDSDYVVSDNQLGARKMVRRLAEIGFDRVFYLTREPVSSTTRNRLQGAASTAAELGLSFELMAIDISDPSAQPLPEAGYEAARERLVEAERPFAVFAANSSLLTGAYWALRELRIAGRDVALACFDEIPPEIPSGFTLLKAVQPLDEIGRTGVRIIMERLRGDCTTKRIVLEPEIRLVEDR